MGGSSWSDDAYRSTYSVRSSLVDKVGPAAAAAHVFTNTSAPAVKSAGLDPREFKGPREARDSAAHPNSNPILVAFDVTGSMGEIPKQFALDANKMPALMRLLVQHNYVEDPQICFAAIGDAYSDSAPIQVGQFESGLEMDEWLTKIWPEGNGGGQARESYELLLWWAANHVAMDSLEKRGKKGYLFTMGDEMAYEKLPRAIVKQWLGDTVEADLTLDQVLAAVHQKFEHFHIFVSSQSYQANGNGSGHVEFWREHLGERLLVLDDIDHVAELIGSTIGLCEGRGLDDVAGDLAKAGMDPAAAAAVKGALVPYSRSSGKDLARTGTASGDLPSTGTSNSTRI